MTTPTGTLRADVAVAEGRIVGIEAPGTVSAEQVVDADGLHVLPGGVDPHCHLMAGLADSTRAAALGGTTTALSFSLPDDGEETVAAFERARDLVAQGLSAVDVGLHAMCYRPNELTTEDLTKLAELGADAVKVFLAYPELGIMATGDGLYRTMLAAKAVGLPVQVHCEDGEVVEALVEEASAGGRTGARTFGGVRPPVLEEIAVRRALGISGLAGARLYVTHLSSREAIDHVRMARAAGETVVTAEACLHHLLLTDDEYDGPRADTLLVAPPLRAQDHVAAVREALRDGTLDTVGSDHSQERTEVDRRISPCGDTHYGIPGIGARLPLLLSWGLDNGIPLERLVHVLCTGPADAFGHRSKGRIAPGADADLVLWDPAETWVADESSFADGTGISPYSGTPVRGVIRSVWARGRELVREGEFTGTGEPGRQVIPERDGQAR
ncbi:dihydroorotase family protein [Amycolatopsis sp. DSM 110486]|uniref:dihydroorotase n=1 Tax=Amycolatopsis sp. DSM 110486 TaxID=2865832 RepID=UPI001C6A8CDC|nr:amidohydrolase family protein [Amycolatopsis sp. DSM 110486]QYN18733.1 amidohydrolase family protein [Amycolatopsis sp. DSM 110486]